MVQADVIARYHKDILKQDVFFNTGTDEHGQKVFTKATESGKEIQSYVDEYADKFKRLMPALGISPDIHFIRTTDEHHVKAAQEFWRRCFNKGDIYKKIYKVKYCVGCELEKTESDLDEEGRCLIHPHLEIELIEEENYFFRFSKYEQPLLEFYNAHPDFVVPDFRFNEIKAFVKSGLQDFSISRLKSKMPWGVPVPDDDHHVTYVWFDALINYVSTLGWPGTTPPLDSARGTPPLQGGEASAFAEASADKPRLSASSAKVRSLSSLSKEEYPAIAGGGGNEFNEFWGTMEHPNAIQIAGKDNLRQQSAMWQAMLMSAGLPNSKQIIIHGFINSGGQKMSKSLGNVADPYQIIDLLISKGLTKEQATDALRYYLLREISTFEDGDYTWEKFVESYNAGLANGIGNLTSRIMKMAISNTVPISPIHGGDAEVATEAEGLKSFLDNYELQKATDAIWQKIAACDQFIQKNEPFKLIKINKEQAVKDIQHLLLKLRQIAIDLIPFLPQTSEKILSVLKDPKLENIPRLFPRIE
jgi:methionyl-tRNA synthetase